MRNYFIILILFIHTESIAQTINMDSAIVISINGDMRLHSSKDTINPFTGKAIQYFYGTTQVRFTMFYFKGLAEGQYIEYFRNGKIYKEKNYENGMMNGEYVEYYENGKKKIEGSYKNGLEDRVWSYYRENGTQKCAGDYVDGFKDNIWHFFDENEKLYKSEDWQMGKMQRILNY